MASEMGIGIGVGLGVPWAIGMIYILYTCIKNKECVLCTCSRKQTIQPVNNEFIITKELTINAYNDFMKGILSTRLQNELLRIHKERLNMDPYIQMAKKQKHTSILLFLKDPDNYPMRVAGRSHGSHGITV